MRNLSPVFAVGLRKGIIAHQTLFQRFQSQCLIRIYLSVGFPLTSTCYKIMDGSMLILMSWRVSNGVPFFAFRIWSFNHDPQVDLQ